MILLLIGGCGQMKRKKIPAVVGIAVFLAVLSVFSFFLFPRLFGSAETKALYRIKSILHSYMNFYSDDLVDFIYHNFDAGDYKYENGRLQLSLGVQTDEEIIDVLSKVSLLCNEIKTYTYNKSGLNGETTDITVRVEHWAGWSMVLEPNSKRVCVGLNDQMSIIQILSCCKEFEIVEIGGYWGYGVSIPDDLENDFFTDFNALKVLKISDIQTLEMERQLNEAVSDLREKGTEVITEVRQSYSLEKADNEGNGG